MPDPSIEELQQQLEQLRQEIARFQALEAERQQAEEDRLRLAAIIESSNDAIIGKDLNGLITSWNPGAQRLYGYTAAEVVGKPISLLIPPDRADELPHIMQRLQQGERIEAFETVRVRKDGNRLHVSLSISPIKNAAGQIVGASTLARDLSERAYVMSSARCLLWYANLEDRGHPDYLHWEMHIPDMEAAQRFLPLEVQEGKRYQDAWYRSRVAEDRDTCDRLGTEAIRAGQSYEQEFRCHSADGSLRWLHEDIRIETLLPGKRWRAVGVCTDITERRLLEQQLLQAQKMEGIGRLAGGIAHDFNNLLTAILGYTELADEQLPEDSPLHAYLANTSQAAERATELTQQLLAFARKQVIEPKVINLNDLIADIDKMLRRLISEDIERVFLPQADLGAVKVDPSQMAQVLINLALNARDAMPNGGKLTIETANITLDAKYAHTHSEVVPGDYVMVAVTDTGTGMTDEIKAHLFEPFFTTKEHNRGTGLGLATSHGIVKQSGGHIWVYSEPGQGTTFKIYLPRVEELVTMAQPSLRGKLPMGTETVLVVEDEPLVRGLAVQMLRAQGYTVLEAGNGVEALEVAQKDGGAIPLLVTDVVMPRMGGKELMERLQTYHPDMKVLFTSGYTDQTIVQHGVLDEGVNYLQKPYTPALLARRVREVLDATEVPRQNANLPLHQE